MRVLRKILKKPYYFLLNSRNKIRNFFIPTTRILLYHRVALVDNDPYRLCVSPQNFHAQIKFLKENYKIIPLVKLVQDIRLEKIQNNSVVITFDDGYADNLYNALPILEELQISATIFLTSGYVGQDKSFYWDEDIRLEDRGKPMTLDEAKRLSDNRLIEIGGHTISHPKLAKIPENDQFKEIAEGKKIVEQILSIPLLGFAYPFGGKESFNKTTIELVKKAGFNYACSNIHERVKNNSDIYALPRYVVRNWSVEEFKKQFKKFI